MEKITDNILNIIKTRPNISHKGDFGRVLIIAGSPNMGGAAIISSAAAVYSGAGLITIATDSNLFSAVNSTIPEAMTLDYRDNTKLIKYINKSDVILIGPGLDENILSSLDYNIFSDLSSEQTLIIDASALTFLASNLSILQTIKCNLILTPHQMEWQRLSKIHINKQNDKNNQSFIQKLPLKTIIVLKSHQTKIYQQNNIFLNVPGNPGMATGGSGDCLAGIIAAFISQFEFNIDVVLAAVYLHSDLANKIYEKNYVVLPENLIKKIPQYMKKVATNK